MRHQASYKGFLKVARLTCSVALHNAYPSGERLSSHRINALTGNRVENVMTDEVTRETVDPEKVARGFEVSPDRYVVLTKDEIDAITPKWDGAIEIDRFVPVADLDVLLFDGAHHVVPDGRLAEEGFSLLRRSMADKGVAAIATMVISNRRRYLAIFPRDRTLLAMTIRFPYEIRKDKGLGAPAVDREASPELLEMMAHVIDDRTRPFNPSRIRDAYEDSLVALVKRKTPDARTVKGKAVPLGDALKDSMRKEGGRPRRKPDAGKRPGKPASRPKGGAGPFKGKAKGPARAPGKTA